ncbi:MAG: response regulator [Candidatus Methanoplasma sp.]|jgi:CheY-like chemotaxis protein|nr:response regulator [Candidatus Methanoplasma sp.]
MRILIVDDNIALQEVLTEVISDAGHSVRNAMSTDGALSIIESFRPDTIVLDADMQDGRGLMLLDRMQSNEPPIETPVVVIRSWNRQIPQDSPVVRACIKKPFTVQDVLESIENAHAAEPGPRETPAAAAVERAEADQDMPRDALAQKKVLYGKSYIMFRSGPEEIYEMISMFSDEGCDVLLVTARKKKAAAKRFGNNVTVMSMMVRTFGGIFNIYGLGTMIDEIENFIEDNDKPVVAFDDLGQIINRNGMNSTLTAIHHLVTKKYGKDMTFLVSVDPKGFTNKDKEILLNHMIYHDPTGV